MGVKVHHQPPKKLKSGCKITEGSIYKKNPNSKAQISKTIFCHLDFAI